MRIGVATDHAGFTLKAPLIAKLTAEGHSLVDFGATVLTPADDFPDYVIPLARAVAAGEVERGVVLCGSGVGASIAANKVPGARAGLISDCYSARQGVEDDDMNIICLGGRIIGDALAWELTRIFLQARYAGAARFRRRLAKIAAIEPDS